MVAEDSEEGNACKRELDEMCKAPASTKKKDDACMLIFQFFFCNSVMALCFHALHLTQNT